MNKIKFKIVKVKAPDQKRNVVRIYIDSKNLNQIIGDYEYNSLKNTNLKIKPQHSYEGVDICWYNRFQNLSELPQKATMILGCTCLEPGCSPVTMDIVEKNDKIVWENLQGFYYKKLDYSKFTWEFDKKDYLKKVEFLEKEISRII